MRGPLSGLVLLSVLALATGCSGPAASTPVASSAPASAPSSASAQAVATDELSVPTGFRVRLEPSETPVDGSDGQRLVEWEVDWVLGWTPTPGAQDYAVWFGTSEGAGNTPKRYVREPELRLTAATGTSPRQRLAQDRDAGLLFTSSQLLVSIAGRDADGRLGPRSPWFPVGDAPADGRPVGTAVSGHHAAQHADR